jgi:hypothetical protein
MTRHLATVDLPWQRLADLAARARDRLSPRRVQEVSGSRPGLAASCIPEQSAPCPRHERTYDAPANSYQALSLSEAVRSLS